MAKLTKAGPEADFAHFAAAFIKEHGPSETNDILEAWTKATNLIRSNYWGHQQLRIMAASGILIRSPMRKGEPYTYNLAVRNGDSDE